MVYSRNDAGGLVRRLAAKFGSALSPKLIATERRQDAIKYERKKGTQQKQSTSTTPAKPLGLCRRCPCLAPTWQVEDLIKFGSDKIRCLSEVVGWLRGQSCAVKSLRREPDPLHLCCSACNGRAKPSVSSISFLWAGRLVNCSGILGLWAGINPRLLRSASLVVPHWR